MTSGRSPRPLRWLGALLVLYLAYPVGAFVVRVVTGHNEGWNASGLWSALGVSVEGATISLAIGVVTGIPLAYVLAHHRGWLSSAVGVVVQLPLAIPPFISGILLIYIVGPYSFLGQLSGERLTETIYGLVIAQSFVSAPFLVVVARSAFRAVDPSLGDVAATLGHGPLARFLRVDVPAAGDGLRAGMILMWLRAFGEYGTTVILAYHPYSLPVYVDNLFSSAPLSQAEAPTVLAFGVAVLVVAAGRLGLPARARRRPIPAPLAPVSTPAAPVGFDIDATVGTFHLRAAHREQPPAGGYRTVRLRQVGHASGPRRAPRAGRRDRDIRRCRREPHRPRAAPARLCPAGLRPASWTDGLATSGLRRPRRPGPGRLVARDAPPRRPPRPSARAALRWAAPAGQSRSGARRGPERGAARRAVLGARRPGPGRAAAGAAPPPA